MQPQNALRPETIASQLSTNTSDIASLVADALTFLKLDGSRVMTGNLNVGLGHCVKFPYGASGGRIEAYGTNHMRVRGIDGAAYTTFEANYLVASSSLNSYMITGAGSVDCFIQTNKNIAGSWVLQSYAGSLPYTTHLKIKNGLMDYMTDLRPNNNSSIGLVLKDRTTSDLYRLYVDAGVLDIEAV